MRSSRRFPALFRALPLLALGVLPAFRASAQTVLVSNLGETTANASAFAVAEAASIFGTVADEISFTTGGDATVLQGIALRFGIGSGGGGGADATVSLYDAAGADGGSLIATLARTSEVFQGAEVFAAPDLSLAAHTTYWVRTSVLVPGVWTTLASTLSTHETGLTDWSIGDDSVQFYSGGWHPVSDIVQFAVLGPDAAVAVPEPSTCAALAGTAALGFTWWRRRRQPAVGAA